MIPAAKLSTSGFVRRLSAFYAAYFLLIGVQLPFFPLWLEAKGLDARQIGLVLAAPALVRVAAVPLLTRIADRRGALRETLVAAAIAAALGYAAIGFAEGALAILIAVALASVAHTPIVALSDALALKGLKIHAGSYGGIRLWGSSAFIAANLGAGLLLAVIAPVHLIWVVVACAVLAAAVSLTLVPLPASPATAGGDAPPVPLWRNPAFLAVILAAGLIQASHALYYGFSTIDWTAAGYGGLTVGLLWALGVISEIVLFALSGRLPPALTPQALLLAGAAGGVLRWTAMAFDPPALLLAPLQVLHAASFGATHLGLIGYIARHAPDRFAATAQGYFSIVSGVLLAVGMGAAGILYARYQGGGYAGMAIAAALGGLIVIVALRRWPRAF